MIRTIYSRANQPHVLSYDTRNGIACFDQFSADGMSLQRRWCESWSMGYTSIISFRLANSSIILSYKSGDGTVHMDRILPNGRGISPFKRDHWSIGYTSIVPFTLNNQPLLLSYKSGDGHMEIDRINPNGELTTEKEDQWNPGWSLIVPFDRNNPSHILSYEASSGVAHFDEINPTTERGINFLKKVIWSPGWTTIAPFQLNNLPHILSYEAGTGIVHFDEVDLKRETGVRFINKTKWAPDWIEVLSFPLNNQPHLLSYKFNGQVDIDRIIADGSNTENKFSRPAFVGAADPCQQFVPANETLNNNISQKGLDLLERIEGNAHTAPAGQRVTADQFGLYNDSEGHCTVGIGHLVHRGNCTPQDIASHRPMDRDDALALLTQDLNRFVNVVNTNVRVRLTQEQFDALVIFAFNVGEGRPPPCTPQNCGFRGSNLLSLINQGNCEAVTILRDGFLRFTSNGELTPRRCIEADLFNNGAYR